MDIWITQIISWEAQIVNLKQTCLTSLLYISTCCIDIVDDNTDNEEDMATTESGHRAIALSGKKSHLSPVDLI